MGSEMCIRDRSKIETNDVDSVMDGSIDIFLKGMENMLSVGLREKMEFTDW